MNKFKREWLINMGTLYFNGMGFGIVFGGMFSTIKEIQIIGLVIQFCGIVGGTLIKKYIKVDN